MILKCYTLLDNSVKEGIAAQGFDSIVLGDPYTQEIKEAAITAIPAVPGPAALKPFERAVQTNVIFLTPPVENDKHDKAHILVDVDPNLWRLTSLDKGIGLIDPCGANGHVILYMTHNVRNALIHTKDRTRTVTIDAKCVPTIQRCHIGNLMYYSLMDAPVAIELSKPLAPALPEAPKNDTECSRSARRGVHRMRRPR